MFGYRVSSPRAKTAVSARGNFPNFSCRRRFSQLPPWRDERGRSHSSVTPPPHCAFTKTVSSRLTLKLQGFRSKPLSQVVFESRLNPLNLASSYRSLVRLASQLQRNSRFDEQCPRTLEPRAAFRAEIRTDPCSKDLWVGARISRCRFRVVCVSRCNYLHKGESG